MTGRGLREDLAVVWRVDSSGTAWILSDITVPAYRPGRWPDRLVDGKAFYASTVKGSTEWAETKAAVMMKYAVSSRTGQLWEVEGDVPVAPDGGEYRLVRCI